MPGTSQKKTRLERVAALELPPNLVERLLGDLQRGDVLLRLGLCLLSAVFLWAVVEAWAPPFPFRVGYVPVRDLTARVDFRKPDPVATQEAKHKAANKAHFVYQQDAAPLIQLRGALRGKLDEISAAATLQDLKTGVWQEFSPPASPNVDPPTAEQQEADF